jgi:hypothetical protein
MRNTLNVICKAVLKDEEERLKALSSYRIEGPFYTGLLNHYVLIATFIFNFPKHLLHL